MTQLQVTFDEETLREVLFGDRGAELLLERVMNEILQAEMTEHLQTDRRPGPLIASATALARVLIRLHRCLPITEERNLGARYIAYPVCT